ncbi:heat shock 70 kDa protein 12B-like [Mercenaria mercenaria]|uniref:heat shock 70 kDa protein 12B-like n=1 Tax=Mercenaria mercenaria TaxID=6596 RepID=UPI00234E8154|nr:heat shock 70 kDa protein 12B-like [Mercenaria mercenaria]
MAKADAYRHSTSSHLLVVAFDFGTTYSGYAFSFRNEPLKVQTNQNWIAGSEKLVSLKTPTCVLLSPNKQFDSFGYEAENKYSELAFDENHAGWLLFRRFKMLLYEQKKLTREAHIYDINGNPMPAMTIFAMSIRYLKKHFLSQLDKQVTGVQETDIQYVLTVPAIWDDRAKQFMREAAVEAGIDTARLRLAL